MLVENTVYIPDDSECRTCNQCSAHCPTFNVNRVQAESPRGRLKSIAKLLVEKQQLSTEEISHLNNCVECLACEKVCPSKMQYRNLLSQAKKQLPPTNISVVSRALQFIANKRKLRIIVHYLLRIYQKSNLQEIFQSTGLARLSKTQRLNALLHPLTEYKPLHSFYPACNQKTGTVALFTGCIAAEMDNASLQASIKLLTHLGYDVIVPKQQSCCGALYERDHLEKQTEKLLTHNAQLFNQLSVDAIVYNASACGAQLLKNQSLFKQPFKEISEFISEQPWPDNLELSPLRARIAVHEPCSQQYPLAVSKNIYQLLEKIPRTTIEPLPDNNVCCGAGGSYMLSHPQLSDAIREHKIEHMRANHYDYVVTSNYGCAAHLAAGCKLAGIDFQLAHPVELLAQQIVMSKG